ncbi:MAG: serine/threonine-protein kinase [Planctomycetota bacterium]|nr:serine/threonine-protein kinase [Planctomycetota bacterium]
MEIFLAACDLPAAQQEALILEMAAGDGPVQEQARRLLRNDSSGSPLTANLGVRQGLEQLLDAPDGLTLPTHIGQFRVVRLIGSGGMGDVFEARQETPNRRVAIKLMRTGLHSPSHVRRFRREVEFLGRLSHPGIAQVFEASVTTIGSTSVPYYAMEFVDGLSLTHHVRESKPGIDAILRLFALICDTVHYAHQQGIVHRDLKPANILVPRAVTQGPAESPSGPTRTSFTNHELMPRILDFGIARAIAADDTHGPASAMTMATEAGQIIGTIAYMSPEQIAGRSDEIDTRTDVYALGVILFELLTGILPHATDGLSIIEAAKLKATLAPRRLSASNHNLRGDLETIVDKALATERDQRYGSASDLAADIRRFLNDEVITARPPTALYQLGKFAKRNRLIVALAGLALTAIISGSIATLIQARSAVRERDLAMRKTEVAESVSTVLFDSLTMATPKGFVGKEPRLIDAIDGTKAQALAEPSKLSPEARAIVLNVLGLIYRERGNYDQADVLFTKALELRRGVLGSNDPNLADSLNNLGLLRRKQNRMTEAAAFFQEAVDVQRRVPVLDRERLGRNIYNLAGIYVALGQYAQAKPLAEESLALHHQFLGEEHEVIGLHFKLRSNIAKGENDWTAAEDWANQAIAMCRKTVGPNHPSIATLLQELAVIAQHNGDDARAIGLLVDADVMSHQVFLIDPPHPTLLLIRNSLVEALKKAGRTQEASELEKDIMKLPIHDGK